MCRANPLRVVSTRAQAIGVRDLHESKPQATSAVTWALNNDVVQVRLRIGLALYLLWVPAFALQEGYPLKHEEAPVFRHEEAMPASVDDVEEVG